MDSPVLGTAVILTEAVGGIFQGRFKGGDFIFLSVDGLVQNFITCCNRCYRFILLIKFGGDQLHLTAENLERLVDISQGIFKFLFALYAKKALQEKMTDEPRYNSAGRERRKYTPEIDARLREIVSEEHMLQNKSLSIDELIQLFEQKTKRRAEIIALDVVKPLSSVDVAARATVSNYSILVNGGVG